MQDSGVIKKTLPQFQRLSRCMSSIQSVQFVIAGVPTTFHWSDNFLFNFG